MDASQAVNFVRIQATVTRLVEAINSGLVVVSGNSTFTVSTMWQCTSGVSDVNSDCSDGTLVAGTVTTQSAVAQWVSENRNTVIVVSVVVVAYVFVAII